AKRGILLETLAQRDERGERLTLELVWPAHHGGLCNRGMLDECGLDFHRADAVSGDIEHVIHASENPVVAVLVALGSVAREVQILPSGPFREIRLHVALVVSPDRAEH